MKQNFQIIIILIFQLILPLHSYIYIKGNFELKIFQNENNNIQFETLGKKIF
jgi:hypothetical protein